MKLKGKVALVTGGGRGLGQGIVKRLAEAGCDVAVADIIEENAKKVAEDVRAIGQRAIALKVDVTKWDQVQNMVKETIEKLGGLDIAVNNAGVISIMPVEDLTEKDWDFVNEVNVKGVFFCCKAVIPAYEEAKLGPDHKHGVHRREDRIPHFGSLHGLQVRGGGLHQRPRQGIGDNQDHRQCHLPRNHRYADVVRNNWTCREVERNR